VLLLQCVAVAVCCCCRVLQCVAVAGCWSHVLQRYMYQWYGAEVICILDLVVAMLDIQVYRVLQRGSVCCSMLQQCVAAMCVRVV